MHAFELIQTYEPFRHALIAGLAVGSACSLLSVLVVLKRMAFIGQGISHAGFGGVGTAIFLGLTGLAHDALVMGFCLATALVIGVLSRRRKIEPDSAIGILLVATMAWGVLMDNLSINLQQVSWYVNLFGPRGYRPGFEALLFGSLLNIDAARMYLAVILCSVVVLIFAALFKELVFFCFDEPVSRVFGVPTGVLYHLLLVVLAVTIVLGMMLVGVILVSALLVIPGATALQISRRLKWVFLCSWLVGTLGTAGGLLLSLQLENLPTGPCIVGILCLTFGLVFTGKALWIRLGGRRRDTGAGGPGSGPGELVAAVAPASGPTAQP